MQANHSNTPAPSQPVARFDRAALPVPRVFYESELGELRRPSRGWACPKAGCPFHASKSKTSFRLHLESGAFRCFGCGAKGGDVLSFARLRYHMDFRQAAGYVGAFIEVTPEGRKQMDKARRERERAEAAAAAEKEDERHERIEARDWLHALESLYAEAASRLSELRQGAHEDFPGEAEYCLLIMSEELDRIRQAETRYWQAAGLEVRHER
jgi:hypothetical protein